MSRPHLSQYRITRRSLAVLLPSLTQQQDHTHSSRKEDRRLTKSVKCPVIQYHSGYGIDRACFFHAFFQISLRYLVDRRGFRVPKPRHGKSYQQQGKHQHHGHTYGQNTVDTHQLFQCAWPVPPLSTTRSDRSLFHDGMMAWYRQAEGSLLPLAPASASAGRHRNPWARGSQYILDTPRTLPRSGSSASSDP